MWPEIQLITIAVVFLHTWPGLLLLENPPALKCWVAPNLQLRVADPTEAAGDSVRILEVPPLWEVK